MDRTFWQKQTDKPLFPDLVWSRPENRNQAGKVLIVGGNLHGFSAVAQAYNVATSSGAGVVRAIMPDAIKRVVGGLIDTADFVPSTPSGSFARPALAGLLEQASWADGVLLAGDLGRNSETAIVLESFVQIHAGPLVITKDAVDYFTTSPQTVLNRNNTVLVLSIAQLQQLGQHARFELPVTFGMDLLHLVDWLHSFTTKYGVRIITSHLGTVFVAVNGQVSTSKINNTIEDMWRVPTAASIAVWWIQTPAKPFEALTTGVLDSTEKK